MGFCKDCYLLLGGGRREDRNESTLVKEKTVTWARMVAVQVDRDIDLRLEGEREEGFVSGLCSVVG